MSLSKIAERIVTLKLSESILNSVENDEEKGYCLMCGLEQHGVEPDARGRRCNACAEKAVFGAQELLVYLEEIL